MDFSKIIEQHEQSDFYKWAKWGDDYFKGDNTAIKERKKQCYLGGLMEDPYKANHRLGSLYNRILVKQLVNYLLGNGIQFKSDADIIPLQDTLGKKFNKLTRQCSETAGKLGLSWVQPYIEKGELKFKQIPSMQIVPIWNEYDHDDLDAVIRFYGVSKTVKNKEIELRRIEYWTDTDVTYYIETNKESNKYILDTSYETNPQPHYKLIDIVNNNVISTRGIAWGKVPFIPLWWNDEKQNQLYTIKQWIDIYDITCSDFANNIDDFQDVYWILKNYGGQNLDEFMNEIKRLKTIKVGGDGEASAQTIQIPTEARSTFLKLCNDAIYKFGQGVDTSAVGDGNITNVVIRSRYADLDLKANEFETQLDEWFEGVLYFVNEWHKLKGLQQYADISLIFDRSMIINELEVMDAVSKQKGIVSDVTMLENHPLVENVDIELERLEAQAQANPIKLDDAGVEDIDNDEEAEKINEENE